jgi:hypothetical protein
LPLQEHPQKTKKRYNYNIKNLESAFKSVQEGHLNVRRAALLHGVPIQTLRDRVNGKVKLGAVLSKETLFTHEEEEFLVQHIEKLCSLGYGLSKSRVNILAAELAQKLGMRSNQSKLSNRWYYAFLKRWDSRLKVVKPRSLTSYRAAALTQTTIDDYFSRLEITMLKYNLLGKPHMIYNLDETGLKPEHRPSSVVAPKSSRNVQSVTSPNSTTVTLISCISASGSVIPPFYVFKGKRYNTELLHGALPGSGMSMSDSGWSNSTIFMKYLKDHFLKYVVTRQDPTEHILLLFDGHASHCTWDIMEWAKNNNIILFVLPPHTSHALQPLDVGCFGPFKSVYYNECNLYMASTRGQVITKYNIAELSSKAYLKTMTPVNITSGFRKAGVCPLDRSKVSNNYTCNYILNGLLIMFICLAEYH